MGGRGMLLLRRSQNRLILIQEPFFRGFLYYFGIMFCYFDVNGNRASGVKHSTCANTKSLIHLNNNASRTRSGYEYVYG